MAYMKVFYYLFRFLRQSFYLVNALNFAATWQVHGYLLSERSNFFTTNYCFMFLQPQKAKFKSFAEKFKQNLQNLNCKKMQNSGLFKTMFKSIK